MTAATHQMERTDQEILFRVVQSYYGVLLATKQLEVAEQAEKTAKSIMDRSQVRFDAGLVVESDLLSAKVRMASREQELIRARNNLELARAQLNTAMGVPVDAQYELCQPAWRSGLLRSPRLRKSSKQHLRLARTEADRSRSSRHRN